MWECENEFSEFLLKGNIKGKSYLASLIRFVFCLSSTKCLQFLTAIVFQYCGWRQIAANNFYNVNYWMQLNHSNIPLQSGHRARRPPLHKLNWNAPNLLKITFLHIIRLVDIIAHAKKCENAKMKFQFSSEGKHQRKIIPGHTGSIRSRHHFNQMPPIS
jgi:hypothetical protein